MDILKSKYLTTWFIPLISALLFFLLLGFVIPYSSSVWEVKKSLFGLVLTMSNFGQAAENVSSLDFTYCLFVPLIFAYLVYLRRNDLLRAPVKGSNLGLGVIIVGVLVYWFGMRAENQYFGYAAIQILLADCANRTGQN